MGLIRAMRDRPELQGVPAILISAAVTPSLDGLGDCWFQAKPFDLADLLDAILHALGAPRDAGSLPRGPAPAEPHPR